MWARYDEQIGLVLPTYCFSNNVGNVFKMFKMEDLVL